VHQNGVIVITEARAAGLSQVLRTSFESERAGRAFGLGRRSRHFNEFRLDPGPIGSCIERCRVACGGLIPGDGACAVRARKRT
jgi:hypothetical protein